MARTRTTKKIAQRIDLNYFKRPTLLKRVKVWLCLASPLVALAWIAWHGFARDSRVYSSGRLSEAHAVLEEQCAACHVQTAGAFSAKAEDRACLACHDGPEHHPLGAGGSFEPNCASCHLEHRGRLRLAAARNEACARCHANLQAVRPTTVFSQSIRSLENGHPEFAVLRTSAGSLPRDGRTIRLNHGIHLKPIRRGPAGPIVQLECGNCHHATAGPPDLTYSDAAYLAARATYQESTGTFPDPAAGPQPLRPASGRERMAPVQFASACAACHLLTFDRRFDFGVPHDKPEVVYAFVVKQFQEYIRAHPEELKESRGPDRSLTGKASLAAPVSSPSAWVAAWVYDANQLLWRKTCKQCHTLVAGLRQDGLPTVAESKVTRRWMPHAKFDHDAHRGFRCEGCHPKALTASDDSELLIPGITTCQQCHAPGPQRAESRCFECHTYHDWSKRKEMAPQFTLPRLRSAGRQIDSP